MEAAMISTGFQDGRLLFFYAGVQCFNHTLMQQKQSRRDDK